MTETCKSGEMHFALAAMAHEPFGDSPGRRKLGNLLEGLVIVVPEIRATAHTSSTRSSRGVIPVGIANELMAGLLVESKSAGASSSAVWGRYKTAEAPCSSARPASPRRVLSLCPTTNQQEADMAKKKGGKKC